LLPIKVAEANGCFSQEQPFSTLLAIDGSEPVATDFPSCSNGRFVRIVLKKSA